MLYEWISPATPTKLCFDIDSSDPSIIESAFLQETLISTVVNRTVNLLQEMDIDCSSIQWYMMDSSRASKFSMHLSCNFYFDEWKNQCEFVKLGYSDIMLSQNTRNDRDRVMDGTIYSEGGRAMRLIGSTKFGMQSYFQACDTDISRLKYMNTYIDNDCIIIPYENKKLKRSQVVHVHVLLVALNKSKN